MGIESSLSPIFGSFEGGERHWRIKLKWIKNKRRAIEIFICIILTTKKGVSMIKKICEICKKEFPLKSIIDGKSRNLQNRKYCLECSPYGKHNTRKLKDAPVAGKKVCSKCKETKPIEEFARKNKERLQSWCKGCLYTSQKKRWKERKQKIVELLGGKCCKCGYSKNSAALDFHHEDPSIKEDNWAKTRQKSWDKVIKESKKCILLCANCHREIHWDSNNENLNIDIKELTNRELKPTGKCPTCDDDVYGTKYCCVEHASFSNRKVIKRPTCEELTQMIKDKTMVAIGKEYGVSDNAVRKWAFAYGIPL